MSIGTKANKIRLIKNIVIHELLFWIGTQENC